MRKIYVESEERNEKMATQEVNIGEVDDEFYRYKMPTLQLRIEGRGNGIRTTIVNVVDIAKALHRPPSYVTKYFGTVLGAQSRWDSKLDKATVNGAHSVEDMMTILRQFIKKFVQCGRCKNPETLVRVGSGKNGSISLKCAACGTLTEVDPREKLCTFIRNNPVENRGKGKKRSGDTPTSVPAAEKALACEDAEELGDVVDRMQLEEKRENPIEKLKEFVFSDEEFTSSSLSNEIDRLMRVHRLQDKDIPLLFFASVFTHVRTDTTELVNMFEKTASVLSVHLKTPSVQRRLLKELQKFSGSDDSVVLQAVPFILKVLYDEEALDEDVFLEWGTQEGKTKAGQAVRKAASPFLTWLRNAEEESSDEEEDD